jgi:hypothetical protein
VRSALVCLAVVGCSKDQPAAPPPPPPQPADAAAVVAPAPADADDSNKITITIAKDRPAPDKALARRCALGGDPLVGDCIGGGRGVAFDRAGTLHVIAGDELHRYRRVDGDACTFEPTSPPLALPEVPERKQPIDGPMFMRSGGPAWQVVVAGDAIYVFDFLAGLYQLEKDRLVAACVDVFGYDSVAKLGKRLLVSRSGIQELATGKKCKAKSAGIDDKAREDLHAIGDKLYAVGVGDLFRYDGTTKVPLAEGSRLCGLTGLAPCGDGVCAIDNNCMQIIQLDADDKVLRTIDDDALFASRPWSLGEAASRDNNLYVYARHRDATASKEVCEAAIYEVPAAALAR